MNYSQSLSYLNSFLNFERINLTSGSRTWNLDRMRYLLKHFGHPEKEVFTVLIAGTKGKGSTGFFLESILRASGYRTGFYSSPHLEDPRERIRLNGEMISRELWAEGLSEIRRNFPRSAPAKLGSFTYFEIMTLLAVLVFRKQKVQAGIFEVGMGGRFDATNTLDPKLVILTPIHMDHEAVLGNTLAKIAGEKAAVVRPKRDVICAPQSSEAMKVIRRKIKEVKARAFFVSKGVKAQTGLKGDFQQMNAAVAVKAAERLKHLGFSIPGKAVRKGLLYKAWPGRLESFYKKGLHYIVDGAHNPASIEALAGSLKKLYPSLRKIVIFGTSRDKNSALMLQTLGTCFDTAVLCRHASPRSHEAGVLALQARGHFKKVFIENNLDSAMRLAEKNSPAGTLIVITGSFYLIGEARTKLKHA